MGNRPFPRQMDKSPNCPSVNRDVNLFITHTTLKKIDGAYPVNDGFYSIGVCKPTTKSKKEPEEKQRSR